MSKQKEFLRGLIEDDAARILAAERRLWNNPETGFKEWKTHAFLKQQFEELGYQVKEAGNIPGFYVDIESGRPGPKVAVFAEMDGLIIPAHPECDQETGAVHACGHHAQCAALLGVAVALKDKKAMDGLCGSIRLIMVPAEECIELEYRGSLREQGIIRYYSGKLEFMARGILDGVDLAMMVHTFSGKGVSCIVGSNGCIVKEAAFLGKSVHAGGPANGINALYAATLALQAANSLRETFPEAETIRFHPIITNGGSAVNAIPDRVTVESYLRGATMDAITRQNEKVNRAFAGAAVAMGCKLELKDSPGFAPQKFSELFRQTAKAAALDMFPEEEVEFGTRWGVGCSDLGDVGAVMPIVQPNFCGSEGAGHSAAYRIKDPYNACVGSAKYQINILCRLLENDAQMARQILAEEPERFITVKEHLAKVDNLRFHHQVVSYNEDKTVSMKFVN